MRTIKEAIAEAKQDLNMVLDDDLPDAVDALVCDIADEFEIEDTNDIFELIND